MSTYKIAVNAGESLKEVSVGGDHSEVISTAVENHGQFRIVEEVSESGETIVKFQCSLLDFVYCVTEDYE